MHSGKGHYRVMIDVIAPVELTRLQRQLAQQIAQHMKDVGLQPGDPVTTVGLAGILRVSRTPVRGALEYLANLGVMAPARRGFVVRRLPEPKDALDAGDASEEESLYLRIAADYVRDALPDQVSEADLMRRYGINRGLLRRVLQRMARESVIERNQGHGWSFAPLLRATQGQDESYRFRRVVEPAAILEPTFELDRAWAARCRRAHETIRDLPPEKLSMIRFFDVNIDFHEGIAASSGNPFFFQAIRAQNRLRRLLSYVWSYGDARVLESCREHLEVLEALEAGDRQWAATLMRRHIELAGELPTSGA